MPKATYSMMCYNSERERPVPVYNHGKPQEMEVAVMTPEEQLEILRRGTTEIISEEELLEKLRKALGENRPLRVKWGVDPTAPDIHLGHTVVIRKMKQFQDLGHQVILLIGDFTGRVGDPTGRSETRKQLSEEEVKANARTYIEQVGKILDRDRMVVDFNSRWLSPMTFADVVHLASKYTVARMLEREDFGNRYREERPIHIHEFLYPLMQGYDSVALNADVELGGTEQKFNILMARHIQREYGQEPEVAVLTPILEGIDGIQRMSKSTGNYIGIDEPPGEMYGKTMSIPDDIMLRYFELVTDVSMGEIREMERGLREGSLHPRDVKMRLAREIVTLYHGAAAASAAEEEFIRVFRQRELPEDLPEVAVPRSSLDDGKIRIVKLLVQAGLAPSNSEAKRLIAQGGVRVDERRVMDEKLEVMVASGMILQVGRRRFARLRLE